MQSALSGLLCDVLTMEVIRMRNKICYIFANISLITAMPVVLFFALLGIDHACGVRTLWGFIFMMVVGFYIAVCGCATAINIKKEFKDT
jgi:hypothetical protein